MAVVWPVLIEIDAIACRRQVISSISQAEAEGRKDADCGKSLSVHALGQLRFLHHVLLTRAQGRYFRNVMTLTDPRFASKLVIALSLVFHATCPLAER